MESTECKYTFTLSISDKDFNKWCIPLTKDWREYLREHLLNCAMAIVDNECHGDWVYVALLGMYRDGHIKQTEYGKGVFGNFEEDIKKEGLGKF